jgi:hypothetical protein
MSLEQQIADAIIIAFDELGGDPYEALRKALYHRTVKDWVSDETTKIALAGGVEMAIPGLHALTIPVGISYLMHKMATIGWGIGALSGAYVVETAQYSDLRNILALYANGNLYNASLLDYQAIHRDAYAQALTPAGYAALVEATTNLERTDITANTWRLLRTLAEEYSGDEGAQRQVRLLLGARAAEDALAAAQDRYVLEREMLLPMERRMGAKLALKLAAQISGRVPARFLMGFVPLAGPIVNAFFNAQTLRGMAEAAEVYYRSAFTVSDLPSA